MVGRSVAKLFTEASLFCKISGLKRRSLSTFSLAPKQPPGESCLAVRLSKSTDTLQSGTCSHVSTTAPQRDGYDFSSVRMFGRPQKDQIEEQEDENVFEVTDRTAVEPVYDVFNYIRNQEYHRAVHGFSHLQPSNLTPFGSSYQTLPNTLAARPKTYPVVTDPQPAESSLHSRDDDRMESSAFTQKNYPGYDDGRKVVVYENNASKEPSRKNYSTLSLKKQSNKHIEVPEKAKSAISLKQVKQQHRQISRMVQNSDSPGKIQEAFLDRGSKTSLKEIKRQFNTKSTELFKKSKKNQQKEQKNRKLNTKAIESRSMSNMKELTKQQSALSLGKVQEQYRKISKLVQKVESKGKVPKPFLDKGSKNSYKDISRLLNTKSNDLFLYLKKPKKTKVVEQAQRDMNTANVTFCPSYGNIKKLVKPKSFTSLRQVQEQCSKIPKVDSRGQIPESFLDRGSKSIFKDRTRLFNTKTSDIICNVTNAKNDNNEDSKSDGASSTRRDYNTDVTKCDSNGYVQVKLGQLKEECIKQKKCKAKKIKFGKLPKMPPPDCPCLEDAPLKEGKPLIRLPRRKVPEPPKICLQKDDCLTPRADDGLKVKPKTLPQIKMEDCPCVETKYVDVKFKRLCKRPVPDPVRVCKHDDPCAKIVRADANLVVEKKVLPKLKTGDCPCIEDTPLKDVALPRLKPKKVSYHRLCLSERKCITPRADDGLKVQPKKLQPINPLCKCVEPEPMKDVAPLKRLCKIKYVEKPKVCPETHCEESDRADFKMEVKPKKLPSFKPQSCPCIEEEIPSKMVELKRLPKRKLPEAPHICIKRECTTPRADEGLKVLPKQLPVLKPGECPCEEVVMKDTKPLRRLCPKPVKEPPRPDPCPPIGHCPPRADADFVMKKKTLPPMPQGTCPCVEPEPLKDMAPLAKLKKRKVKPPLPCPPPALKCIAPRADDGVKVRMKQLPKLDSGSCPCIEPVIPEDVKPLKRLRKKEIPEPPKVCPRHNDCEETPRADEDDWMYWQKCLVDPPEPCPPNSSEPGNTTKRNFSTHVITERVSPKPSKVSSKHHDITSRSSESDWMYWQKCLVETPEPYPSTSGKFGNNRNFSTHTSGKKMFENILRYEIPNFNQCDEPMNVYLNVCCSAPCLVTKPLSQRPNDVLPKRKSLIRFDYPQHISNIPIRFFSTTQIVFQSASKLKENEGPRQDPYLQPKNQKSHDMMEKFLIYPEDRHIEIARSNSRAYLNERIDDCDDGAERDNVCCKEQKDNVDNCQTQAQPVCEPTKQPSLTLWERIVNFFKARPNCPSPEEFKKMRLREDAEKAAAKAGLCLYDPKEMLNKNEKDLPKVITADDKKDKDC